MCSIMPSVMVNGSNEPSQSKLELSLKRCTYFALYIALSNVDLLGYTRHLC